MTAPKAVDKLTHILYLVRTPHIIQTEGRRTKFAKLPRMILEDVWSDVGPSDASLSFFFGQANSDNIVLNRLVQEKTPHSPVQGLD